MVNAVPPGLSGNAGTVPIPTYGPCGHRYQTAPQTMTETCRCGMFAVGLCSQCRAPRCGTHGDFLGAQFVCDTHIAETAQADAERAASVAQQEAESAARRLKQLTSEVEERIHKGAPGFPEGECSGGEMSAALQRLVPAQLQSYVVGYRRIWPKVNYRHWGPAVRVEGWGIPLERQHFESNAGQGYHGVGLIVSNDGPCFRAKELHASSSWMPSPHIDHDKDWLRKRMPADWLIPTDEVIGIREQVLIWRGIALKT